MHEFNEIEHISVIHAKYGSHHLQKEVADTNTDSSQKNENTLKSEDQISLHTIIYNYRYNYNKAVAEKQFNFFKNKKISEVSISKQGPPPKFSC